jgi:hypothetical protein
MDTYFVTFKGQHVWTSSKPRPLLLVENNCIQIFNPFKNEEEDVRNTRKVDQRGSLRRIVTISFGGESITYLEGSKSLSVRPFERNSMKMTLQLQEFEIRATGF